jgi:aspartate/methionine/tyrosine aminotransferase
MSNSKEILKNVSNIFRRNLDEAGFVITKKGALGSYYILLDVTNQPKTPALRSKFEAIGETKMTFAEFVGKMMIEEAGIALLHASAFELPKDELFYRLSFADFNGGDLLEKAEQGEEINEEFVMKNCPKLFEGL